jgi:phosphatidylserine/phosphatidylglycerophosphate/cardiolipin synthase-like enzyme
LGGCLIKSYAHWILGWHGDEVKTYIQTAKLYPWLIECVEGFLSLHDVVPSKNLLRVFRNLSAQSGRPLSNDHALIAIAALEDLGIVSKSGLAYRYDSERFRETAQLRMGIKVALNLTVDDQPEDAKSHICVSTPPSISAVAECLIRESCTDLRSGLLDLISGATRSIIIASPFWDASTTGEMVSLLGKRLNTGVQLSLIGRFSNDLPLSVEAELRRIAANKGCRILSWFEVAGNETETFHFKAVTIDDGRAGYIGSANMTASSLRSRMEIGIILKGDLALQLDRILRIVITLAKPMSV